MNMRPLFNVLFLSIVVLIVVFTVSTRFAVATLPVAAGPAPAEVLRVIEAVRAADIRAKLLAREKELQQATVAKQPVEKTWGFYGGQALAIGTGTVVGVLAFNFINTGMLLATDIAPAITAMGSAGVGATAVSRSAISVYALVSAILGGVAGNYLYLATQTAPPMESANETLN